MDTWLRLTLAATMGFAGCDADDPSPAADGASSSSSSSGGEPDVPLGERACAPADPEDEVWYDEDADPSTRYCPPTACNTAANACLTPEFAAQTFASESDEEAARCVLEHLRDRVPGHYAYLETDNNLYGYRTDLFVFERGLVLEEVGGSDEFETIFIVDSGELEPVTEFERCLAEGPASFAVCLRSAVRGNRITLGELSCPD